VGLLVEVADGVLVPSGVGVDVAEWVTVGVEVPSGLAAANMLGR
jgi:hypothetical protein